jgi:hypothetical protein
MVKRCGPVASVNYSTELVEHTSAGSKHSYRVALRDLQELIGFQEEEEKDGFLTEKSKQAPSPIANTYSPLLHVAFQSAVCRIR